MNASPYTRPDAPNAIEEVTREKRRDSAAEIAYEYDIRSKEHGIDCDECGCRTLDNALDGRIPGGEGKPTCYATSEAIARAINRPELAGEIHLLFSTGDYTAVGRYCYGAWQRG